MALILAIPPMGIVAFGSVCPKLTLAMIGTTLSSLFDSIIFRKMRKDKK